MDTSIHIEYTDEAHIDPTFWLVVHLQKPALALAVSDTILERVQHSFENTDIVVDIHTQGIMLEMSSTKVLTVTVQNLSFQLDCKGPVELIKNPALRFQLQISIEQRTESEFAVRILVGTDAGDTPKVRDVMDLIYKNLNDIELSYPDDAQETFDIHEEVKMLATFDHRLVNYKVTCSTNAQRQAIDTWCRLLIQGKQSRTKPSTDGPSTCPSRLPTAQPSKQDYRTEKSKSSRRERRMRFVIEESGAFLRSNS